MDAVQLYARVKRSVIQVHVTKSDVIFRDGVVVALRQHNMLILASSYDIYEYTKIGVLFSGQNKRTAKILGICGGLVILSCPNPPQIDDLEEVEVFEGDLQDFDKVYTYTHHLKYRVLSPGNIMSTSDDGFHHDCSAHTFTKLGSPVFNNNAQLVGLCTGFQQYLSADNITDIATKIDICFDKEFKSIKLTFENLRNYGVPPAYYAHLAAFRARYYVEGESSDGGSTPGSSGQAVAREGPVEVRQLLKIKDNVKDDML